MVLALKRHFIIVGSGHVSFLRDFVLVFIGHVELCSLELRRCFVLSCTMRLILGEFS